MKNLKIKTQKHGQTMIEYMLLLLVVVGAILIFRLAWTEGLRPRLESDVATLRRDAWQGGETNPTNYYANPQVKVPNK